MNFKRVLLILLALLTIGCVVFAACSTDTPSSDSETTVTEGETSEPAEDTEQPSTDQDTTAEDTTEEQTTRNEFNDPISSTSITFTGNESFNWKKMLTNANQCSYEIVKDEECGYVLKLTTKDGANDPFIMLAYKDYLRKFNLSQANADEYKYMKIKYYANTMMKDSIIYFATESSPTITGSNSFSFKRGRNQTWREDIVDIAPKAGAAWSGKVTEFRFDVNTNYSERMDEYTFNQNRR